MTDLPPGWEWITLGEVVDVLDHLRVPVSARERALRVGDVPYFGATGRVGWINESLFDEPLVLLGEDGAPFLVPHKEKAYSIEGPTWVNNHAHVLRPLGGIHVQFLTHLLNSADYRNHVTGTTRLKLPKSSMLRIPLALPPLAEQRRIVSVLDELEFGIRQGELVLNRAKCRGNSLSRSRSLGHLYGVADRDLRVHPGPPPVRDDVRDDRLPEIPISWTWRRLGEIADVVGGITKDSAKQADHTIPLIPYLRVANVQRGAIDLREIAKIRATPRQVEKLRLEVGDVLLNEGGDRDKLGRGWVWEGQIDSCIHQNHVFRARVRDGILHPKLLAWHANNFGHWFERNGKQSVNLASISLTTIKQLPVPVPPRELQVDIVEEIEEGLSSDRRLREALAQASARARQLSSAVLSRAFAGELTDQDVRDEPTSVLLERIRAERAAAQPTTRRRRTTREVAP